MNRHEEIYAESAAPFIVTVVDPCDVSLTSFTAPVLEDQDYTIGERALEYRLPAFNSDPPFCEIRYSIELSDSKAELAYYFIAEELIFYFESVDLSLAGAHATSYTVTITGEIGTNTIV